MKSVGPINIFGRICPVGNSFRPPSAPVEGSTVHSKTNLMEQRVYMIRAGEEVIICGNNGRPLADSLEAKLPDEPTVLESICGAKELSGLRPSVYCSFPDATGFRTTSQVTRPHGHLLLDGPISGKNMNILYHNTWV